MQLYRIHFFAPDQQSNKQKTGEIHLGFYSEEDADQWCIQNNITAFNHKGLPAYSNLGALYAS